MSLVESGNGNGLIMPVAPMYAGGGSGGGFGGGWGGDNGWWIILLFLFALGGWGNGFGGNGGGNGGGVMPYLYNAGTGSEVQRGFDQAAVMSGVNSIQSGVQNLSTQLCNCCCDMQNTVNQGFNATNLALCNGFAGVNQNVSNGFAQSEIADNARQIANMQQAFANQTAMSQGFNQISSQFADCCCENRLASADLKYTIATENCADRAAISDGIRDILVNNTANTQRILDQLCADKIDAKNEKIADLERQLQMADLRASQIAQTAQIRAGQVEEIDAMYNRLRDCPVPTMPVYGSQPIFTCPQQQNNCGCGCGCGGNNF